MKRYPNWKNDFDHINALIDCIYENYDMMWQEDWFDLYDNHLVALIESLDQNIDIFDDDGQAYTKFREFIDPCRDSWFQEDYYDFQDAALEFGITFANSVGGPLGGMLAQKYPMFYKSVSC